MPRFDSGEGSKRPGRGAGVENLINIDVMQVIKSVSSFAEVLRDLRGCGSLALPVAVIPDFIAFCARFGIYPNGGALCGPESDPLQWLYI